MKNGICTRSHTHSHTRIPAKACGREDANVGIDGNGQWNRMGWHDTRACFKKHSFRNETACTQTQTVCLS